MITLFHAPKSRSANILWLLEELDASYEIKQVNIRRGDGSGALDPADPHPHGKVPAIVHNGALIHEGVAIAVYLTDLFPKNGIGPVIGSPLRGPYLSWLAYYTGVMEPAFMSKFLNVTPPRGSAAWVALEEVMAHVNKTLSAGPYLLGDTFSAADIFVGGAFAMFLGQPILPKTPLLEAYVKRSTDRPARARAAAKDSGSTKV
jgi:glutathione S-transferase